MNRFSALLLTSLFVLPSTAGAQSVLVHDGGGSGYAVEACTLAGFTCTSVTPTEFVTSLGSASWSLVVMDLPSEKPAFGWADAVAAHVDGGGALIFSHWDLSAATPVVDLLEVSVGASHDAVPIHAWTTSPLFDAPNAVPSSLLEISDMWGTNGFFLTPVPPAYAVAGFVASETDGQAAIVVGNSDRTIFNGFLYDDYIGDEDGDGTADMVELLANEITFLLDGGGTTGPCTGLADGVACTTSRGDGTCHTERCCTGCWDGTACRGGTTASSCGAGGGACDSCIDGVTCTSDVCTAGACANPPAPSTTACDDGLYCTATDRCAGTSASCVGSGTPCDDGESCTLDTCDEATRVCGHMMTSGCFIGGACVGAGIGHVAYPCLVCDPTRNASDWSPRSAGAACGAASCAAGRVTDVGACDAAGACVRPVPVRCPSGICADATSCAPTCEVTGCPSGQYCTAAGTCAPLATNGSACSDAAACASGFCVDGLCCDAACDGTCEACDGATPGTCAPVPAGMDPDAECAAACDGAGACAAPPDAFVATDAGVDAGASDVPVDASTAGADAGTVVARSGCACRAGSSGGPTPWLALLLAAVWWRRR